MEPLWQMLIKLQATNSAALQIARNTRLHQ